MIVAPSLFDSPSEPVLSTGALWVSQTLLGSIAITLCVIAVAFVGFFLMSGRLAVRDAARVTIGCFVLLGAPAIALSLQALTNDAPQGTDLEASLTPQAPQSDPLPPAKYDPYAGASLPTE